LAEMMVALKVQERAVPLGVNLDYYLVDSMAE